MTAELTDEQIIDAVRTKDKELYVEIVKRYEYKLSHYLRRFVRDNEEVEDVLQDVFIKAYVNLNGFNSAKKFSSWIYRITHNEAVNFLKKKNRKPTISIDEKDIDLLDKNAEIARKAELSSMMSEIEECLAGLNPKSREAFVLYFFEGKSYEEIGDIMRIPTSSVGVLIMRSKKDIKRYLEKL